MSTESSADGDAPLSRRVLVAFDKFKNSLTAVEACAVASEAIVALGADWQVACCPLSDGGEGFGRILTHAAGGEWKPINVTGPRGGEVTAGYGIVRAAEIPPAARGLLSVTLEDRDGIGLVEMAGASGLALLPYDLRDPWQVDTRGTGELMRAAAADGVRAILLGVGGSATNDLGLGALAALGVHAVDATGASVFPPVPARWKTIHGFRGGVPTDFPQVLIACDVNNPLLGAAGCTAVYGPQKGLKPEDVAAMDAAAEGIARRLVRHCNASRALWDEPGAGAAGGIAFGLRCAAGARILPGAELVGSWLDLDRRMAECDIVVTGEGRFDSTSLRGKGPGELVRRAVAAGKPAIVLAGSVEAGMGLPAGVTARAISPEGLPLQEAMARSGEFLRLAIAHVGPLTTPPGPAPQGSASAGIP